MARSMDGHMGWRTAWRSKPGHGPAQELMHDLAPAFANQQVHDLEHQVAPKLVLEPARCLAKEQLHVMSRRWDHEVVHALSRKEALEARTGREGDAAA